jgi:hypothetical protein
MFFFRKNFGNVWKTVKLAKDEFADVETKTVGYIFRVYGLINKKSDELKMEVHPIIKAAMLIFYAMKFESFANDRVEANAIKEAQEAKEKADDKQAAPQAPKS